MKDDFYIGWSEDNPRLYKRLSTWFFGTILLILLTIATVFTVSERGFITSYYEYGVLQEVTGYLVDEPVWAIRMQEGGKVQTIPLVGFGKMGAEWTLGEMMEASNVDAGSMVTMRGMIFHYQGRKWMELTEMEDALVQVESTEVMARDIKDLGSVSLTGEIVDPKCFFGVMNPATKAIHRSCAIRCISGGMPPILAIRENGVFVDYYFLKDQDLNPINDRILPYVGVPVKLSGSALTYDDWKVLKVDNTDLKLGLLDQKFPTVAMCF